MHEKSYSILLINHTWLKAELESLGHRVLTAGYRPGFDLTFNWSSTIEEVYRNLPQDFTPERIVYYDDSADPSILNIEEAPCPSVFLSVDIHHHYEWHKYFLESFSHTLVAQKDYIPSLLKEKAGASSVSWFPLWATQNVEPALHKDIPVSFRGTLDEKLHPGRKAFLEKVSAHVPLDYAEGAFPDVYARSKIVLNEAVKGDLNFRVFEGMISGALMITPKISNGMEELFVDGEDVVLYEEGNVLDAVDKINYYLSNDEERERIASSGRKKVLELHSLESRARELSRVLGRVSAAQNQISLETKYLLYSNKLKILWVYLRKFRLNEIQHSINTLLQEIEELVKKEIPGEGSERSSIDDYLFSMDALNSDLLDEENYHHWINLLSERFPEKDIIRFIHGAFEKVDGKFKHPQMAQRLKESRSLVLRGFLDEI